MSEMVKNKGYLKKGTALFLCSTQAGLTLNSMLPIFANTNFNDSTSIFYISPTQIKLLAGRKYHLRASLEGDLTTAGYLNCSWYNETTSSNIGSIGAPIAVTYNANVFQNNTLEAEITPSIDTIVSLKITAISGATTYTTIASMSYAYIEEVEAYLPVVPTSYKRGTALFGKTSENAVTVTPNNPLPVFETTFFNDSDSISVLSTTQIKLLAGKKYQLIGELNVVLSAESWCATQFYNVTTSSLIGTVGKSATSQSTNYYSGSNSAKVIISPTVDTIISFYIITGTTASIYLGTKVMVEEIEAYLPVVPDSTINQPFASITLGDTTGQTLSNYYQTFYIKESRGITVTSTEATITKAGYYMVMGQQLVTTSSAVYFCIQKNNATQAHGYTANVGVLTDLNACCILNCAVGDTIRIYYQGTTTNAWSGSHCNLSIFYLR